MGRVHGEIRFGLTAACTVREDLKMVVKIWLIASFAAVLIICATAELPTEENNVLDSEVGLDSINPVVGLEENTAEEDLRQKREAIPDQKKGKGKGNGKARNGKGKGKTRKGKGKGKGKPRNGKGKGKGKARNGKGKARKGNGKKPRNGKGKGKGKTRKGKGKKPRNGKKSKNGNRKKHNQRKEWERKR